MSMMLPAAYFRSVEFDSFFAPFFYAGAVKDLLINFKFGSHPEIAGFIARQMLPAAKQLLREGTVDAVTFVPISRSRKRIRGYDQSEMIAKRIAKDLGIQFYDKAIEKVFDVPPQHEQKYFSRFGNVFGAYDADESLCKDRHFLLIDDIATTGATLNECAKMLKIANAESVHCLTAAVVESKENRNFYHNDDNKTVINAAGRFESLKTTNPNRKHYMQSFAIDLKPYIPEQGANRLKKAKIRFLHCFPLIRKAFNTENRGSCRQFYRHI